MPFYTPANFRPQRSIGYLGKRISKFALNQIEARFAALDISFSQWIALNQLNEGIGQTASCIARHLGHDSGATTRLVDLLEQRGFVSRTRDTGDRRVVLLAVTAEGRRILAATTPHVVDYWNEVFEEFSDDEAEQLLGLMQRLYGKLQSMDLAEASE